MKNSNPEYIYKIVPLASWDDDQSPINVPKMPIDEADGYVHLSTLDQLVDTLRLHFAGRDDIAVLSVRTVDIVQHIKWEPSRGGALFPHLYDELPRSAVAHAHPVSVDAGGNCRLPTELS